MQTVKKLVLFWYERDRNAPAVISRSQECLQWLQVVDKLVIHVYQHQRESQEYLQWLWVVDTLVIYQHQTESLECLQWLQVVDKLVIYRHQRESSQEYLQWLQVEGSLGCIYLCTRYTTEEQTGNISRQLVVIGLQTVAAGSQQVEWFTNVKETEIPAGSHETGIILIWKRQECLQWLRVVDKLVIYWHQRVRNAYSDCR